MIYVFTGNGKGKTSACLGQVIRAIGRGLSVGFAQFIKADNQAGEQVYLKRCLGDNFLAIGLGFFLDEQERQEHRLAAEQTLNWAFQRMPTLDLLILDEALYALSLNLLSKEELLQLFSHSRIDNCHLIISGRGFPEELAEQVDLITEMKEIKHPWQYGRQAVAGLDH